MEFNIYKEEFILNCEEALEFLEKQLSRVSLGTANPQMFSILKVNYYDSLTPIGDVCSITHPESQQLIIKPFDKELVKEVYTTIIKQNYSVTVQDEGDKLRIIFPILTTEKRKESVKQLSSIKESAKVKIRNERQSILKKIKADEQLSEDEEKQYQNNIQKIVDEYNSKIDSLVKQKEEHLMKM